MAVPVPHVVRFGLFELDVRAGQLSRNGVPLRLSQQPVHVLAALIERPGEIVTRDELHKRLWATDVFVDFDHGLNKSVQKLREALGDSASSPRYIETIPRIGYRFIAPVMTAANGAKPVETPPSGVGPEPKLPSEPIPSPVPPAPVASAQTNRLWLFALVLCLASAAFSIATYRLLHPRLPALQYTQLTDFTDSAASPALSSDGRMIAFIRGSSPFMSADPIYVKMLAGGEAKRVTDDASIKYALSFSPDDTQIAYTVLHGTSFSTVTVPTLGGDPHLFLENAAGLSWLDAEHLLFSKFRSGLHLGVVSQDVKGQSFRELYYPPHERSMVHYSSASPDRKKALAVLMDGRGYWASCQLLSLEPPNDVRPVGPQTGCTSAAWSPDGSLMYFIATVHGQSHLWRQGFPNGQLEQLTFGPMEEEGLAVEPNGRSVITSLGAHESEIWIHDEHGERALSSEGEVGSLWFAADAKTIYYLVHRLNAEEGFELWRVNVASGKSEAVLPGIPVTAYDLSPDQKQVVYTTEAPATGGQEKMWLATLDRTGPPRLVGHSGDTLPHFGPNNTILFRFSEGNANYLGRMNTDGSGRSKAIPNPIVEVNSISPQRHWLAVIFSNADGKSSRPAQMLVPLEGGAPRQICASICDISWGAGGQYLFVALISGSETNPVRNLAIPLRPGEQLPAMPPGGLKPLAEASVIKGAQFVQHPYVSWGQDPAHFAYVKDTTHRNLFRITLQ